MGADDGMRIGHGLPSLDTSLCDGHGHLLDARMYGREPVQALLKEGAEPVVRLGRVREQGISSCLWLVEDVEESRAWGLLLVAHIGVPSHRTGSCLEEGLGPLVTRAAMDEMNLWVPLWRA